jgi:DNA-directed RNA polymerase subunit RPC12/RpoP
MPMKIECSNCGGRYAAPDELAGKQTRCPGCGEIIQVPAPSPTGSASAGLTQAVYCGGCHAGFSAPQHLWGKSVGCPQCGIAITIPVSPQSSTTSPSNFDDVFGSATAFESSAAAQPSPLGSPMTGGAFQRPQAPVQRKRRWNLELSELYVPQILGIYVAFGIIGLSLACPSYPLVAE